MAGNVDQAFVRQMQKKVEQELAKKEKEVLAYWRDELDKIMKRRHHELATLSTDISGLIARMDKRLGVL
jgi:hypothetical protein